MAEISVLLPTFRRNKSGKLGKAIASVLAQTLTDFELLVVDDGSTDGSAQTIQAFCQADPRVIHIRFEENVGLPALTSAMALKRSQGELIAWIFDDCEWEPTYLQEMSTALSNHPEAGIVYARCEAHFADGSRFIGDPLDIPRLKAGNNHISNGSAVIRRDVYYTVGFHDPRILLIRRNDWDFWQRAVDSVQFLYLPKVLTHEYGVALADSLGNSYEVNIDLVHAVARIDRAHELHPDRIEALDVLSLPIELTHEQAGHYLLSVTEFAIKGWRKPLMERIRTAPMFATYGDVLRTEGDMLKWWAASKTAAYAEELRKKEEYIAKQSAYIENQQAYIDKQQADIESQQVAIERQQASIESQQAVINNQQTFIDNQQAYIDKQQAYIDKR